MPTVTHNSPQPSARSDSPGRRAEGRITDGALEISGRILQTAFRRALKGTEGKQKRKGTKTRVQDKNTGQDLCSESRRGSDLVSFRLGCP